MELADGSLMAREEILARFHAFVLTSHRLMCEESSGFSSSRWFAVPLECVGLCEISRKSRPWLIVPAVVAILAGLMFDPLFEAGLAPSFSLRRALLCAGIVAAGFVFAYIRSRRLRLVIHAGGAIEEFGFSGLDTGWQREFVRCLHQARADRVRQAANVQLHV